MYDQVSGQVFKEWLVPRRDLDQKSDGNWSRRLHFPAIKPRNPHGPRSLVDTAISVIANNVGELTEQHLEGLPQRLLARIWRFLEARGVCFHAWKLFSKLLLLHDEDKNLSLYRYRQHICNPHGDLKEYIQPLMSSSLDFITHLVISGGQNFTTNEMLCLTDIRNLAVLELIQPGDELGTTFPNISDRLVRGWTEKPDPFPLLRVLRIWGDDSTTQGSLRWVSKFPALALYDVMGARDDWASADQEAINQGWEPAGPGSSGLEDSLLRYLMLFTPLEESKLKRLRDLARSIDSDLLSLCGDSGLEVKFVAEDEAPPLLDYLTDNAKVNTQPPSFHRDGTLSLARACHGIPFEAWAFWLYSFIGQLSHDHDLEAAGAKTGTQTVIGPFVLPSKPMASLYLGHSGRGGISSKPSYVSRGLFATKRFTFTRPSVLRGTAKAESDCQPVVVPQVLTPEERRPAVKRVKSHKRKRLDDILGSLTR